MNEVAAALNLCGMSKACLVSDTITRVLKHALLRVHEMNV